MSSDNFENYRYVKVIYDMYSPFEYSYIDENRVANKGDYVVVPVGKFNEEKIAKVVSAGDYSAENAPFPVERTKKIIRLATEVEAEQADESWGC